MSDAAVPAMDFLYNVEPGLSPSQLNIHRARKTCVRYIFYPTWTLLIVALIPDSYSHSHCPSVSNTFVVLDSAVASTGVTVIILSGRPSSPITFSALLPLSSYSLYLLSSSSRRLACGHRPLVIFPTPAVFRLPSTPPATDLPPVVWIKLCRRTTQSRLFKPLSRLILSLILPPPSCCKNVPLPPHTAQHTARTAHPISSLHH